MGSLEDLSDEQRLNLARAANQVLTNPETSREFKRLWMKANPKVRFPEVEQDEQLAAQLKLRDDKIQELETKQLEQEAERRRQVKRDAAAERGLNPDEVEALIVERGKAGRILDYESAMELLELQQQSAPVTPASDQSPTRPLTSLKELWEDPAKWARDQTHAAIDELKKRRRIA